MTPIKRFKATLIISLVVLLAAFAWKFTGDREVPTASISPCFRQAGLALDLNKKIMLDKPVTIKTVLFDFDFITFLIDNNGEPSPVLLNIQGDTDNNNQIDSFCDISTPITPNSALSADLQKVTVPCRLKLKNQAITITATRNNARQVFKINYPGSQVAEQTRVYMFDENGQAKTSLRQAQAVCVAGIDYTLVKTRGLKINGIEDVHNARMLQRSFRASAGNYLYVYEPIAFPRNNISIKYVPDRQTIQIDQSSPGN